MLKQLISATLLSLTAAINGQAAQSALVEEATGCEAAASALSASLTRDAQQNYIATFHTGALANFRLTASPDGKKLSIEWDNSAKDPHSPPSQTVKFDLRGSQEPNLLFSEMIATRGNSNRKFIEISRHDYFQMADLPIADEVQIIFLSGRGSAVISLTKDWMEYTSITGTRLQLDGTATPCRVERRFTLR